MDTENYTNLSLSLFSYEVKKEVHSFCKSYGDYSISFTLQSVGFFKETDENTFIDVISGIIIKREDIKSAQFLYDFGRNKTYVSKNDVLLELKRLEEERELQGSITGFFIDVDMPFDSVPKNFKPSETGEVLDEIASCIEKQRTL